MEGSASEVKRKAKVLDSIFEIEQKYGSVTLLGEGGNTAPSYIAQD